MYFAKNIKKDDNLNIIYSKDFYLTVIAIILKIFGYKICFEYHQHYKNWRNKFIIKHSDYLLPLTEGAKRKIIQSFNICEDKILVVPDAVDLEAIKEKIFIKISYRTFTLNNFLPIK